MLIALFGATGGTGRCVLDEGLARGHAFRCLVRRPEALDPAAHTDEAARLTVVAGDTADESAIAATLEGCEAVLLTLGNANRKPNTELSDGTARIVKAMQARGLRRLVAITSLGCGDSLDQVPGFIFRELIVKRLAREIWADKNRQEAVIRVSGLDWTLLRPGGLTHAEARDWRALPASAPLDKATRMIPRAAVARAMIDCLEDEALVGETVTLVAG
ncbi:MAG: SDR family oxidoreductase [Gammaproteobacteria bacterium]|nr:SDR family oxidoreductase [Gammaproteobacteria bacterium]